VSPRLLVGTGETTWLRAVFPDAYWVDLVRHRDLVGLVRDPGLSDFCGDA